MCKEKVYTIKRNKVRQLKKGNMEKFAEELSSLNLQPVLEIEGDASQAFDIMSSIVQPIFDRTCPVRTVKR